MRLLALASAVTVALAATPAVAQTAAPQVTATAQAAGASYSVAGTDIGTLLDNPATKAVLVKHAPQLVQNDQIDMARGMTLRDVQQYAPDMLTEKVLADIDADLAKVPAKP